MCHEERGAAREAKCNKFQGARERGREEKSAPPEGQKVVQEGSSRFAEHRGVSTKTSLKYSETLHTRYISVETSARTRERVATSYPRG